MAGRSLTTLSLLLMRLLGEKRMRVESLHLLLQLLLLSLPLLLLMLLPLLLLMLLLVLLLFLRSVRLGARKALFFDSWLFDLHSRHVGCLCIPR